MSSRGEKVTVISQRHASKACSCGKDQYTMHSGQIRLVRGQAEPHNSVGISTLKVSHSVPFRNDYEDLWVVGDMAG